MEAYLTRLKDLSLTGWCRGRGSTGEMILNVSSLISTRYLATDRTDTEGDIKANVRHHR